MGSGAGAGAWVLGALPFVVLGYLFIIAWPRTRYFSATADGQRLFFMCAAAGFLLAGLAYPFARLLGCRPVAVVLEAAFGAHASYVEILAFAMLFGALFAILFHCLDGPPRSQTGDDGDRKWHMMFRHMAYRHGSPLQRLFIRAETEELLVVVTLNSRKVYCGHVLKLSPSFRSDDLYVEVIPMFSAVRNKDTLKFEGRLDYPVFDWWRATVRRDLLTTLRDSVDGMSSDAAQRRVIKTQISSELDTVTERIKLIEDQYPDRAMSRISIRDWAKVIPFKLIESASIYDEAANRLWFSGEGDTQAEESAPPGTARTSGEASPPP